MYSAYVEHGYRLKEVAEFWVSLRNRRHGDQETGKQIVVLQDLIPFFLLPAKTTGRANTGGARITNGIHKALRSGLRE